MSFRRKVVQSSDSVDVVDRIRVQGRMVGVVTAIEFFPYHSPSQITENSDKLHRRRFMRSIDQVSGDNEFTIHWQITSESGEHVMVDGQ